MDHHRLELDPHPSSARAVRKAVSEFCEGRAVDLDAVLLCASEVFTNALLHGQPPISLELAADEVSVRVGVFDGGGGPVTHRGDLVANPTSGRGLAIVETLSSRWSDEPVATGGKVVWFEVDLDAE